MMEVDMRSKDDQAREQGMKLLWLELVEAFAERIKDNCCCGVGETIDEVGMPDRVKRLHKASVSVTTGQIITNALKEDFDVIHQRWSCCQCHIMDVEAIKTGKQGPSDTSNVFIVRWGHAIACCRHSCNYTAK
jgi:hypothetical protein